jgi:hypothetical protein
MKAEQKKEKPEGYIFGRPTKYRPEFPQLLLDFFSIDPSIDIDINHYKNGEISFTDVKQKANRLPTLHKFAESIGVLRTETLTEWCKIHPDFSDAYTRAKELQQYFIAENALNGSYNPQFAQFLLHNTSNWKIKHEESAQNNVNITLMLPPNERDTRKQIGQGEVIEITGVTVKDDNSE